MPISLRRVDHDPWAPKPAVFAAPFNADPSYPTPYQPDPTPAQLPQVYREGYGWEGADDSGPALGDYGINRVPLERSPGMRELRGDEPARGVQKIVFGGEQAAKRTGGPNNVPVAKAQELAKQGKNADTIFQSTGWYRAPDGKWKYIISDQGASLNKAHFDELPQKKGDNTLRIKPGEEGKPRLLSDVLNHPELFKAYPQLKNTTVELLSGDDAKGGVVANYNPVTNKMRLSEESEKNLIPTILHETQHNIQRAEGFAAGGNWQMMYPKDYWDKFGPAYDQLKVAQAPIDNAGIRRYSLDLAINNIADKDTSPEVKKTAQTIIDSAMKEAKAKGVSSEAFNQYVEAVNNYRPIIKMQDQAREDYKKLAGETESRQVEQQFGEQNWNKRPNTMPGFAPPSQQFLRTNEQEGPYKTGTSYKMADKEALPVTPPFDPWDSGRSMAPTDIAPLTDVSDSIRDYWNRVTSGEMIRGNLQPSNYYDPNRSFAENALDPRGIEQAINIGLGFSGGGLGIKRIGPPEGNIIRVGEPPKTYEAATGDIVAAVGENPRGYALDIAPGAGSQVRTLDPAQNPQITMQQVTPLRGPQGEPWPQQGELPAGVERRRVEAENTNQPTYPIAGGYRLMPAFTKKDQWSIIDPRGEIMFRSPDKATTQKVFDFVNKGTTGLAVGGLGVGGALVGGEAQAAQPSMQYTWPGPQSQAEPQGYDLQEVDHDPFTPGIQSTPPSQPRQIPFTPPQAIPTQSWSFGNNAPDATPTRFSDIAPPLNYYQPLSNTNGVPTYGG